MISIKRPEWLKASLFWQLLLFAPLIVYYLFFVNSREAELLERTHLDLSNVTNRVSERIDVIFSVLKNHCNSGTYPSGLPDYITSQIDEPRQCKDSIEDGQSPEQLTLLEYDSLSFKYGDIVSKTSFEKLLGEIDLPEKFSDVLVYDSNGRFAININGDRKNFFNRLSNFQKETVLEANIFGAKNSFDLLRYTNSGSPHYLIIQTIQPSESQTTPEQEWSVVGIIDEEVFTATKLQFQPDVFILLLALAIVLIVAGPILKFTYIGRADIFKKRDLILMITSGLGLVSITTLALLTVNFNNNIADVYEEKVAAIAEGIAGNVRNELYSAVQELQYAAPLMKTAHTASQGDRASNDDCGSIPGRRGEEVVFSDTFARNVVAQGIAGYAPKHYPNYSTLIAMDGNGCQIVKWSGTNSLTPVAGPYKDRDYFARAYAARDDLYRIDDTQFYLQVINARTTGTKLLMISTPVNNSVEGAESEGDSQTLCRHSTLDFPQPCVVVMSTGVLQALQPALPTDLGLALVAKDGELKFHHQGLGNIEDNLKKEVGNAGLLEAALEGGKKTFTTNYQGKVQRFRVTPLSIDNADLNLVTFYPRYQYLEPLIKEAPVVFGLWLLWFFAALLLFIAAWNINRWLKRRLFSKIYQFYCRYQTACLVGAVIVFSVGLYFPLSSLIAPIVIVPVLLAFAAKISNNLNERLLPVTAIFTFIALVMVTVPVYSLFNYRAVTAYDEFLLEEFDKFAVTQENQHNLFNNWRITANLDNDRPEVAQYFARFWQQYPIYSLDLSTGDDCGETPRNCVQGSKASFIGTITLWSWLIPLVLLSLVAMFFGIGAIMRRVLGTYREAHRSIDKILLPAAGAKVRYLVLGAADDAAKQTLFSEVPADKMRWIDMRSVTHEELDEAVDKTVQILTRYQHPEDLVVLDNFDSRLYDDKIMQARITFLGRLLVKPSLSVVILSTVDPLDYLSAPEVKEKNPSLTVETANLLAQFRTYHNGVKQFPQLSNTSTDNMLYAECNHPNLREIYSELSEAERNNKLELLEVVSLVRLRANAIYRNLWNILTKAEKILLVDLANGNLINPHNWHVGHRLKSKHLVISDPFYRIFNRGFKDLVLQMGHEEDVDSWRSGETSTWKKIRGPWFILLSSFIIFIFVTQYLHRDVGSVASLVQKIFPG